MSAQQVKSNTQLRPQSFYLNWILANAVAETIGIGSAAFIAVFLGSNGTGVTTYHPLVIFMFVVLGGTLIEGVFVGLFQGWTLRQVIPVWKWTVYTAIGAGIAWILGMLPSTMIELFSNPAEVSASADAGMNMAEMSPWLTLLLAGGMGLVSGSFLAVPQWMLLRRVFSPPTWVWIPANMVAWAGGMIVIFASMDFIPLEVTPLMAGMWGAFIGAITGIVVGAIHGIVIRRFFKN